MKINLSSSYDVLSQGKVVKKSLGDLLSAHDKTIVYFYPKDNTPGCTIESKDFTCLKQDFTKKGIHIIWVSRDDIESHKHFIDSESLDLDLIADTDGKLHEQFGVIGEKNMYGKISVWVIRSTFLLDKTWNVLKEWRNVKATGHVEKVLKELG